MFQIPPPSRPGRTHPLAAVPALGDVMRGAGDDDAGNSGHEASLTGRKSCEKDGHVTVILAAAALVMKTGGTIAIPPVFIRRRPGLAQSLFVANRGLRHSGETTPKADDLARLGHHTREDQEAEAKHARAGNRTRSGNGLDKAVLDKRDVGPEYSRRHRL